MNKGSRCREFSAPALISRHLRQPLSGSEDPESPGAKQAQGQSRTFGVYRASVNPKGWRLRPEGAIAKALAPAPAKRKGCRVPSDRSLRVRPAWPPQAFLHRRLERSKRKGRAAPLWFSASAQTPKVGDCDQREQSPRLLPLRLRNERKPKGSVCGVCWRAAIASPKADTTHATDGKRP